MRQEDVPLPDWFPEVSMGETIYVRRDPRKNSNEPWIDMKIHQVHRSKDMPNLDVVHRGRELIVNVVHIDDPRLNDPNFMATATNPDAPGLGGVFIINPIRARQEAEIAKLREDFDTAIANIKRELHSLKISVGRKKGKPEMEEAAA